MSIPLFILGLLLALAVAWGLMICMFWLLFAQAAGITLQAAAKEREKHGK